MSLMPIQSIDEDKFQHHSLNIHLDAQSFWNPFGGTQIFHGIILLILNFLYILYMFFYF